MTTRADKLAEAFRLWLKEHREEIEAMRHPQKIAAVFWFDGRDEPTGATIETASRGRHKTV